MSDEKNYPPKVVRIGDGAPIATGGEAPLNMIHPELAATMERLNRMFEAGELRGLIAIEFDQENSLGAPPITFCVGPMDTNKAFAGLAFGQAILTSMVMDQGEFIDPKETE